MPFGEQNISYVEIDETWKSRIAGEWSEKVIRHLYFTDGFTITAFCQEHAIGLISVNWRNLPASLDHTVEGYINIIEVQPSYRKRGIARQLINLSIQKARDFNAYQLRAWSSDDKTEAISMWKQLGFGLCPATTFPGGQEVHGFFVSKVLNNPSIKQ